MSSTDTKFTKRVARPAISKDAKESPTQTISHSSAIRACGPSLSRAALTLVIQIGSRSGLVSL